MFILCRFIAPLLLATSIWVTCGFAAAADIYPYNYDNGSLRSVVIEGRIEQGDFEKFIRVVREGQGRIWGIAIFSPGGDFDEAIKIGRALRALGLSSLVPSRDDRGAPLCGFNDVVPKPKDPKNCVAASAAFFIHIGAMSRNGLHLIVHRPYYSSKAFGHLSEQNAKKAFDVLQENSRVYMEQMGVPKRVQEDVLGTASDNGLVLDETTVRTHFLGDLPYYQEWMRNKCSKLDGEERPRLTEYRSRYLSSRDMSKLVLNADEYRDFQKLKAKEKQEGDCQITASKERRLAAYERYFGVKPDDAS